MLKSILITLTFIQITLNACTSTCKTCNQTQNCPICSQGPCQACTTTYTCTLCSSPYYLSGGSCNSCPSNCQICQNSYSCNSCYKGYSFSVQKSYCIPKECSISNCNNCTNYQYSICYNCKSGYYLNSNKCQSCSSNCQQCNRQNCTKCASGYSLSTTKYGQQCQRSSSSSYIIYIAVAVAVAAAAVFIAIIFIIYCFCKRRNQHSPPAIIGQGFQQNNRPSSAVYLAQSLAKISVLQSFRTYYAVDWEEQQCSICLYNNKQVEINCGHMFHLQCILLWTTRYTVCPQCRQIVRQVKWICGKCTRKYKDYSLQQARRGIGDLLCGQCSAGVSC